MAKTLVHWFHRFQRPFNSVRRDKPKDITCCIVENGRTSDWFLVEAEVNEGCFMSGFLRFNVITDWVMRKHPQCKESPDMEAQHGPRKY